MQPNEVDVLAFISGDDKVFIIPPFQRNYSWTKDNCKELFDDIIALTKNTDDNKNHYFGNVLYYVSKNTGASLREFILIDGQQRVTTTLLLLCALRDSDEKLRSTIERRYLLTDLDNIDDKFRVRLKQTAYDADIFSAIVENQNCETNNNIYENYKYFKELIKSCGFSAKEIFDALKFLKMIEINLQITNDLTAVQTIFEKINSTGKPLTSADLIRNFLLIAKTSKEQDELYEKYWVKIEKQVSNDNISQFAKSYLVLKICNDVKDRDVYSTFKSELGHHSHEEILAEMLKFSKYYHFFKFEDISNKKLNRIIQRLNILKSNDVYSLLMYIFDKLYDVDEKALIDITNLLCDFLIRYRIVTPSFGGGTLRAVYNQLLRKLQFEDLELTYDNILYELSNSAAEQGRFPSDDEFKQHLQENLDINYAKVVLMQIEESEYKNISVEYSDITMEHCMPQKIKNTTWIKALGGKEEAERIYNTYLDSIGNLCPMSRSYNSKNSNKPWDFKLEQMKDVQFNITRELKKYNEWTEKEIIKRNKNLAERACKAITSPLERERAVKKSVILGGSYIISELPENLAGTNVSAIIYNKEKIEVFSWRKLFGELCRITYNLDSKKFAQLVEENYIHKSTSKYNESRNDPIIWTDDENCNSPMQIENTNYFYEGNMSANRIGFYTKQLLEYFDLQDSVEIILGDDNS